MRSLAGLLLVLATAAAGAEPGLRLGGFRTWDSGLFPSGNSNRAQWLDEETVVFAGDLQGKPTPGGEHSKLQERIILWRLGSAPEAHDDKGWDKTSHAFLCAADGELAYSVAYDPKEGDEIPMHILIGTPDALHERVIPAPEAHPPAKSRGIRPEGAVLGLVPTCEPESDPSMAGHRWASDGMAHYRLDFGESAYLHHETDIRLESRTHDRPPRTLSLTNLDVDASCTRYASFTGLFYLSACTAGRRAWDEDTGCYRLWSLDPGTATLTKLCILQPDPGVVAIDPVPTRRGIIFSAQPVHEDDSTAPAGVYLAEKGGNRLLFSGYTTRLVPSPSGCRLAFAHADTREAMKPNDPGRYSFVAVDLCR
jgi:hypothetical protein